MDRYFQVRVGTSHSGSAKISAGVPQSGILSPLLFNIYAADQPTSPFTTVAEYANDKAIISIHDNPQHIKIKRIALNARLRFLKTLMSNNKHTPSNTKLLIYKSLFKPMWTYGLQLWGNAKISNTNKIQTFQNNFLRKITNSPPYISNLTLHTNLKIKQSMKK